MPFKKGQIANPSGKGGFGDHPENKARGWYKKEGSIPYWQNYFLSLTVEEFIKWGENRDNNRYIAQEIAYRAVKKAREDLAYLKEITDRTNGKATMHIDHNIDEQVKDIRIEVVSKNTKNELIKLIKNLDAEKE